MAKTREEIAKRREADIAIKKLRHEYKTLEKFSHNSIEDIFKVLSAQSKNAKDDLKKALAKYGSTRHAREAGIKANECNVILQRLGELNYHMLNIKKMNKELTESVKKSEKKAKHFRAEAESFGKIAKLYRSSEIASKDKKIFRKALKIKSVL